MEEILKNTPLFRHLDESEIKKVAGSMTEVKLKKNEVVFKAGLEGDALYIIGKGSALVEKKDVQGEDEVLAILHRGESFGEISLVDREVRSATCVANEDSMFYKLSRADFESLLQSDKDLALNAYKGLVDILCERLRATNQALTFSRSLLHGVMDREK